MNCEESEIYQSFMISIVSWMLVKTKDHGVRNEEWFITALVIARVNNFVDS